MTVISHQQFWEDSEMNIANLLVILTLQQFVSENSWNLSISSHIHCIPQAVGDLLLLVLEIKKDERFLCFNSQ